MTPAALLYLAPVILLWAATPLLLVELAPGLPVLQVNFLAGACAVAVLAAAAAFTRRWPLLARLPARGFVRLAALGLCGIFPYTSLYYLAFSLAPAAAGEINIVNYLWPVWIVLLSAALLRERLSGEKVLGVLLSFAGVVLVIWSGGALRFGAESLPACLAAAAGAFFWGLFSVLSKRWAYDPLSTMLVSNAAALLGFALLLPAGPPLLPPTGRQALLLLLLGGAVNGLGYLFWVLALRAGDTARLSSAVYLVPFVALLYLALAGRASIRAWQLVGLALVVAGPSGLLRLPAGRRRAR